VSDRAIITAIQKMAGVFKKDNAYYVIGRVKSVSDSVCSVIIQSGEVDIEVSDVLLQVEICDGLLFTPKKDSNVLVCLSTYNPPYIAMFSDIDEFYLQVGLYFVFLAITEAMYYCPVLNLYEYANCII